MQEKTIVFKGVTAWEENNIHSAGFGLFKRQLEQLSNGRITMEYACGPESIPAFDQGAAVRDGIVDVAVTSGAYYSSHVPEAPVLNYSELSVEEEWENGALHFMNEIHNTKLHVQFIGRASGMKCCLYVKEPVNSIDELKGKRFRATASYVPFLKAVGAEAIIMPAGDIYTAIEQGLIDGVAWPNGGITDLGLQQQIKYKIVPEYYKVDGVIIMNLDTWRGLCKEDQDLVQQAARAVERDLPGVVAAFIDEEKKLLKEAGMKEIQLPEGQVLQMANDAAWQWVETSLHEHGKQLKGFFVSAY